jgi:hypothetical protein
MDGENTKTHNTKIRIRYDEIWMEKKQQNKNKSAVVLL